MTNRMWIVAGLAVSLLVLSGTSYGGDRDEQADALGGTGVTLYEISERVTFNPDPSAAGVIRRNATSPLQGFAELGTPLCPSELLITVPRMQSCTVIATGTDSVSTVTGMGPVTGTFDVVINAPGNSSVHVPDLPVISGTFSGDVDLSLAVLHRVPLGSIAGRFTITQMADPKTGILVPQSVVLPFKGTFRLPFAIDTHARHVRSDRKHAAFYLADDFRIHRLVSVDLIAPEFSPRAARAALLPGLLAVRLLLGSGYRARVGVSGTRRCWAPYSALATARSTLSTTKGFVSTNRIRCRASSSGSN